MGALNRELRRCKKKQESVSVNSVGSPLSQIIGFRAFVQKNVTRFSLGDEVNEKRFRSVPNGRGWNTRRVALLTR